jgi:hypothetical protein
LLTSAQRTFNVRTPHHFNSYFINIVYSALLAAITVNSFNTPKSPLVVKKNTRFREVAGFLRRRKVSKNLLPLESTIFNASGVEEGLRCFTTTLDHASSLFRFYHPTNVDTLALVSEKPTLSQIIQPINSSKGLRLLQINPFFSKDLFNYSFLFKYVTTRFNLNRGAFFNQSSLATDYLFRDGLSLTASELNLNPAPAFSYEIRRRLVKSFAVSKFTPKVTP